MNPLAERLQAAADRVSSAEHAATWGPWTVHPSWAGQCAVVTDAGHPIAIVSHGDPSPTALADAALIALMRNAAPVMAEQLARAAAMAKTIRTDPGTALTVHESRDCGNYLGPNPIRSSSTCHHFDDALALADAVLGGES